MLAKFCRLFSRTKEGDRRLILFMAQMRARCWPCNHRTCQQSWLDPRIFQREPIRNTSPLLFYREPRVAIQKTTIMDAANLPSRCIVDALPSGLPDIPRTALKRTATFDNSKLRRRVPSGAPFFSDWRSLSAHPAARKTVPSALRRRKNSLCFQSGIVFYFTFSYTGEELLLLLLRFSALAKIARISTPLRSHVYSPAVTAAFAAMLSLSSGCS